MRDLHDRFGTLDRVSAPDLWGKIERRRPADLPLDRSWRRIGVAALALAVAVAGLAVAARAFLAEPVRPATKPFPIVPKSNGRVAFVGGQGHILGPGGQSSIYTMDLDGSGLRRITKDGGKEPAWSPDGARLAFVIGGEFPGYELDVVGSTGEHRVQVMKVDQYLNGPTWSPDGKRIAIALGGRNTDYDLYVMNADGTHLQRITNSPGNELSPDWSPDGTKIVYAASAQRNSGLANLFVVSADGGKGRRLTKTADHEFSPTWSPDGKRIAFVRTGGQDRPASIEVMNAEGDGVRPLFTCVDCLLDVAWSPDGTKVLFSRSQRSGLGLWMMNADGTDVRKVDTGTLQACCASWQALPG